jgi:hypothetical protein
MTNPRPYTLTGMAITRMRDGQMAENWNQTDDLGMMQLVTALAKLGIDTGRH